MSTLSSASTLAQVRAASDDNARYAEDRLPGGSEDAPDPLLVAELRLHHLAAEVRRGGMTPERRMHRRELLTEKQGLMAAGRWEPGRKREAT